MNYSISIASPEMAEMVVRIGRETFHATWKHVNTEEDLQQYMKEAFDLNAIRRDLEDSVVNTFFLAFMEGAVVGYSKLRRDTVFKELKGKKTIEIERLYVSKSFHGKGVANALMNSMLDKAKNEGVSVVCLGVDVNNHRAIRFYTRYGFEVFGRKIFRVGQAEDLDQLMKLELV